VTEAKAGRRRRPLLAILEGRREPVALGALDLVDLAHECVLIGELGAQRPHRLEGKAGLGREQLADHGRGS
jgi:hypothetical protein